MILGTMVAPLDLSRNPSYPVFLEEIFAIDHHVGIRVRPGQQEELPGPPVAVFFEIPAPSSVFDLR